MDQIRKPVETAIGTLHGRGAFGLEIFEYDGRSLHLRGTVGVGCATASAETELFYAITFTDVLALQVLEFDTWAETDVEGWSSSFDEIINSKWQARLRGKVTALHRHFSLVTYDDVIDVICDGYEIKFRRPL